MNLFKKAFAVGLGLLLAGVLSAAVYYGFNPVTGLNTANGVNVSAGPVPVVTGTCGTIPVGVGGSSVFTVLTAGVTACTLTVTLPIIAPATVPAPSNNGIFCIFVDETTQADANNMHQASHTTTSCTSNAAVIVAGDLILVEVQGY
jgi:hypothetical protein